MNKEYLKKYAELVIKSGINIQKGQTLVLSSPVECVEFARDLAELAYKAGAKEVVMSWNDDILARLKYLHASEEVFETFPEWRKEFYTKYANEGAAFLSIDASDPEIMRGVNPERLTKSGRVAGKALEDYRERLMKDKNAWCIVSIPTKAWAKKVFPELSEEEAVEKLWDAIFYTVRATEEDPVAAWEKHKETIGKRTKFLNDQKFKYFTYKNSLGTDLKIEFPKNNLWLGATSTTPEGTVFIPNMPTEEVFTMPLKTGVNGKVFSSKPLNHNGNLIENFSLTFKDGKVVDFTAEKGYETLKELINTDEGSHYLGEVALVPYDSPISNTNILFYNTLFDENASCHLAVGEAYPSCIEGGANMSKDELKAAGVNDSVEHSDFMVGTKDLSIVGTTEAGKEIVIFKDGNFAF